MDAERARTTPEEGTESERMRLVLETFAAKQLANQAHSLRTIETCLVLLVLVSTYYCMNGVTACILLGVFIAWQLSEEPLGPESKEFLAVAERVSRSGRGDRRD